MMAQLIYKVLLSRHNYGFVGLYLARPPYLHMVTYA